ncbi:hypothetical protein IV203_007399 [Nitzschia inconspicua]|uniref:Uncharacterized protein n=1 Tax=Nitzschia inconspicua TaxID=303405 RepID=A0A9K3KF69_9STRA|nr:hypothetical protein IV203_007399 [Nitzschia inconspicua]
MAPIRSPFLATAFLIFSPFPVQSKINLTPTEHRCLEQTGTLFEGNEELIAARHNYATSMETEMTSLLTMTAKYPEDKLRNYEKYCRASGGVLHTIKIDFFDCKLRTPSLNTGSDVELTLKNFANCLSDTEECSYFNQEGLLEAAWEELGLHCDLEEGPGGVPFVPKESEDDDTPDSLVDDDLAKQEEKATSEGTDQLDRAEKNSEYIPKEAQGKKKKSGASRFFTFVLTMSIVGGVVYAIYIRKVKTRRLPWGGVTTSRFQTGGTGVQSGFVSDYHMISGEEEMNFGMGGSHELQLSSNFNA